MEDLYKKIKTVMLILIWVSMGLCMEIGGPTMLDLRMRFQCDYEDIARSVSAQGVGIFFGALIGGLFVDILGTWKDILITIAQVMATVSIVSMPYVGQLSMLWFMFFVIGTASGMVNVAGQRILLELWKARAASPMHAMHMGFGIGAVAAPLIANHFLAVLKFEAAETPVSGNTTSSRTIPAPGGGVYVVVEESRVEYAYVTIGVIAAILSSPFFINPFYKYFKKTNQEDYNNLEEIQSNSIFTKGKFCEMLNPKTYADGSFSFGIFVFVIVLLYFINVVGGEQLYGNFVRTFSVDQLKFSRNEASFLDTAYWGSFTLGRLTGSVLSHFIQIRRLFVIDVLLNLIAITLLAVLSGDSHALLWTFTAIVGFTIAPLFPACISYTNTQIEVGGVVLTLIVFATGFGDMLYIWIAGVLYDSHGPRTVLYAMEVSAVLVLIITLVFVGFTYKRVDRFHKKKSLVADTSELIDGDNMTELSYTKMKDNEDN